MKTTRQLLESAKPAAFRAVCADVACGSPLHKALRKHNFSNKAFYNFMRATDERRAEYAHARELLLEVWEQRYVEVAATPNLTRRVRRSAAGTVVEVYDNVERSRLHADAIKWTLSKLKRGKYGDEVDVNHKGSVELTLSKDDTKVL